MNAHPLFFVCAYSLDMATIDALLNAALSSFLDLHGAERGNIQVLDTDEGHRTLRILAHQGFEAPFLNAFARVSADDESACGRALRFRCSVVVPDTEEDDAFAPYRLIARQAGYRSVISTPIISRWDHIVGIISTHFPHPHTPARAAIDRGEVLARQLAHDILYVLEPRENLVLPRGHGVGARVAKSSR